MTKDIKDYLHLYVGCECVVDWKPFMGRKDDRHLIDGWILQMSHNATESIRPVLRPLSDMTEEETEELIDLPYLNKIYSDVTYKRTPDGVNVCYTIPTEDDFPYTLSHEISFTLLLPDTFKLLLSKSFDLFGLIKAGLAIDKTTITT